MRAARASCYIADIGLCQFRHRWKFTLRAIDCRMLHVRAFCRHSGQTEGNFPEIRAI